MPFHETCFLERKNIVCSFLIWKYGDITRRYQKTEKIWVAPVLLRQFVVFKKDDFKPSQVLRPKNRTHFFLACTHTEDVLPHLYNK